MTGRPRRATSWTGRAARHLLAAARTAVGDIAVAAGTIDRGGGVVLVAPEDSRWDQRFELGSVSKTMTATLLALEVGEGRLRLDDRIGCWLAAGDHAEITVGQLATHMSGLPSDTTNAIDLAPDPADPWAGYDFSAAEQDLGQLPAGAGTEPGWEYSNLGYQLLGLVLERAGGSAFATLLGDCVLGPLGLTGTRVGPTDDDLLLPGRTRHGPARWSEQPLGAGGVQATATDLARYARACLFPPRTPLGAAIARTLEPAARIDEHNEQALAWVVRAGRICQHGGMTAGFTSCVSLDPDHRRASVLVAALGDSPQLTLQFQLATELTLLDRDPHEAWPDRDGNG